MQLTRQRKCWGRQYRVRMRCTLDLPAEKKLHSVKSTWRTFVRAGRISFDAMDWRGYSFLIGLGKSWTYFVSVLIFSYVASKVGFNITGEESVLRLQNGLRFKLRESHRLKNIFHKTSLCKPESRRTGSMWVGNMVAVRKAVGAEGSSVTLCLGHFYSCRPHRAPRTPYRRHRFCHLSSFSFWPPCSYNDFSPLFSEL